MKKSGNEFLSLVDKEKAVNQYLWRIIIIQSIVIVVLVFGYLSLKEVARVKVELPSKLIYKRAPVVVAGISGANETYYKLWGEYLIEQIANFSFENITNKLEEFAKTMHQAAYALNKRKLQQFNNFVQNNLVQQKFTPLKTEIKIVSKQDDIIRDAVVAVQGEALQSIGKTKKIRKSCGYKLKLHFSEGVLYVENFATDCF